ncbi:MAG: N-acetylmuramoyl-L-alanine amidase [Chlamydiales bacterium]|nr:N-acetylmuramoyl-L-alanine amidase [Chlamydiales bacterium]
MLLRLLLILLCTACAHNIPDQVSNIYEKPFKQVAPQKEELIVIDAGHGGKDTGSASKYEGYEEKSLTLKTALLVRDYLQELGYKTVMTRQSDAYIPLSTRAEMANSIKANLFVSIHYNHCPSREPHGIEVFYYKETPPHSKRILESQDAGQVVASHIVKYTGLHSRGVKQGNLAVVRETHMPAILIEAGFLSNPHEREKIKDEHHQKALAWGIAKGIDHYLSK